MTPQELNLQPILLGWAAAAPWIASAAGAIISGILSKKGADKQAKAAQTASDRAERARRESLKQLDWGSILGLSNTLFPGLFSPGGGTPSAAPIGGAGGGVVPGRARTRIAAMRRSQSGSWDDVPGGFPGRGVGLDAGPYFMNDNPLRRELNPTAASMTGEQLQPRLGFDTPLGTRASGGPVEAGQPYVVGEKGPEVMVPGTPGTVVPNPGPTPQPTPTPLPAPVTPTAPPPVGGPLTTPTPTVGPWPATPGAAAGAAGTTKTPANLATSTPAQAKPTAGSLVVQKMLEFLQNPGKGTPAQYERDQANANQVLNASLMGIQGDLTGRGVDPESGWGKMFTQSAVNQNLRARNDAANDQKIREDALYREDVDRGVKDYLSYVDTVLGLAKARAAAAGGQAFPQVQPINPYEGLASGVSTLGYTLSKVDWSKVLGQNSTTTPGATPTPTPTGGGTIGPHGPV